MNWNKITPLNSKYSYGDCNSGIGGSASCLATANAGNTSCMADLLSNHYDSRNLRWYRHGPDIHKYGMRDADISVENRWVASGSSDRPSRFRVESDAAR